MIIALLIVSAMLYAWGLQRASRLQRAFPAVAVVWYTLGVVDDRRRVARPAR